MRTLLLIGPGDVARRALPQLLLQWQVVALCRRPETAKAVRAAGAEAVEGDLDSPETLAPLAGLAEAVLYTAPPPAFGTTDPRLRKCLSALTKGKRIPQHWVYISTTGVYGDAGGAWVDENTPVRPHSARAQRRVDAEMALATLHRDTGSAVTVLRAPGIYAEDRLPLERLTNGTPLFLAEEDSWSNHIHADDLALGCSVALAQTRAGFELFNACDSAPLKMGEWFDKLADATGLARAPRLPRQTVQEQVSPMLWSFLAESRRVSNQRLRDVLGVQLRYPTVDDFLNHHFPSSGHSAG